MGFGMWGNVRNELIRGENRMEYFLKRERQRQW